jgi:choline dehydrogenase-like flavoprotein
MRMQANRRHIHGRIPTCRTAFYSAPPCHGGVFDSRRWVSRSVPVRTGTRPSGHPEKFCSYTLSRPNYLADELDRRTLVAGMKIARRIVNNKALDRYRAFEMNPGDRCQTDDELLGFARQYGHTAYHVVGTCKMGHDPRAVVNDELRVHGLASLRVVDASIMPTMTSGNTNAPVIMIAEKAADMVRAAASQPARAA